MDGVVSLHEANRDYRIQGRLLESLSVWDQLLEEYVVSAQEGLWTSSRRGAAGLEAPAAEESKDWGWAIGQTVWGHLGNLHCVHRYICLYICGYVCIFSTNTLLPCSTWEENKRRLLVLFVCLCECLVFLSAMSHVAAHVFMYIYLLYTVFVWVPIRNRCSASLLTWSCSSLASIWLLHLATPNVFLANSMNAKKQ